MTALNNVLMPILQLLQYFIFIAFIKLIRETKNIFTSIGKLFKGDIEGSAEDFSTTDIFRKFFNDLVISFGVLYLAGKWIWNNIIKPGWSILQNVGKWIWETILKPAWEFLLNVGQWIWEQIIVPGFNVLLTVGQWIWDNIIIPGWEIMLSVGKWIWDQIIKPGFSFLGDTGKKIWEQIIKPSWDFLKDVGQKIWEQMILPGWEFLKDVGQKIWDMILKPAFDVLETGIINVINGIISLLNGFGLGIKPVGGRQFGGVIPKGGLYKLEAGETVSRGNTTNVKQMQPTINIVMNGNNEPSEDFVTQIANRMTTELNAFMKF